MYDSDCCRPAPTLRTPPSQLCPQASWKLRVDEVLRVLQGPGLPDEEELSEAAYALNRRAAHLQHGADTLSADARRRLHSKLGQLGQRLAALEGQLQRHVRRGDVARIRRFPMAAAPAVFGAALTALATGCAGRDAQALLSAAALFLGSGRAVLESLLLQQEVEGRPLETFAVCLAGEQLQATCVLLDIAQCAHPLALTSVLVSPKAVLPWLSATAAVLQQAAQMDGVGEHEYLEALAALCTYMLSGNPGSPFAAVSAAVAAHGSLRAALASLFLGAGLRSAIASLVPAAAATAAPRWRPPADADRRLANHWHQLHNTVAALASPSLDEECNRQLHSQPEQLRAVQRMVIQLVEALPQERPAGLPAPLFANGWGAALHLLHSMLVTYGQQSAAAAREAAWAALQLLPKAAAATAAATAQSPSGSLLGDLMHWDQVSRLLGLVGAMGGMGTATEAAQLLGAVDAAVNLLPLCLRLWQQRSAAAAAGEPLPAHDILLAHRCVQAWRMPFPVLAAGAYGAADSGGDPPPGSPAEHAAAARAAWRLQLSSTRALHWAATAAPPEWLQLVGGPFRSLLGLLEACLMVLEGTELVTQVEKERIAGDAAQAAAFRLEEAGYCAARWEAQQLVFAKLGPAALSAASQQDLQRWTCLLAQAAASVPTALLTDAAMEPLLLATKAALRGRHDQEAVELAGAALHFVMHVPPLWAAVLAGGGAGAMLKVAAVAVDATQEEAVAELLGCFQAALKKVQREAASLAGELEAAAATAEAAGAGAAAGSGSGGPSGPATAPGSSVAQQLRQLAGQIGEGLQASNPGGTASLPLAAAALQEQALRPAEAAARLLRQHQQQQHGQEWRLELARAAATRACAYLRCANLGQGGGAAAGEGEGSSKCSQCRTAWYCSTACSHADWREGGHRRVCRALAAERQQRRAAGAGAG